MQAIANQHKEEIGRFCVQEYPIPGSQNAGQESYATCHKTGNIKQYEGGFLRFFSFSLFFMCNKTAWFWRIIFVKKLTIHKCHTKLYVCFCCCRQSQLQFYSDMLLPAYYLPNTYNLISTTCDQALHVSRSIAVTRQVTCNIYHCKQLIISNNKNLTLLRKQLTLIIRLLVVILQLRYATYTNHPCFAPSTLLL